MAKTRPSERDRIIGAHIRTLRAQASLSQRQLGEAVGKTFQQIQKYEKGANVVPGVVLEGIAKALQVDVSRLLPSESGVSSVIPKEIAINDAHVIQVLVAMSRLSAPKRKLFAEIATRIISMTDRRHDETDTAS